MGNKENISIHKSAFVDEGAQLNDGCKIWHFSHIMSGATLGQNCNIGQNVFIASDVTLGRNVKVQNNVSIYKGVDISDDVFLGPSMVFTNVMNPRSHVNRKSEYQKTIVSKGVSIGANATIVCGTQIGEYAFIGAGTVVTKDVLPFELVVGNPAKRIGWMSKYGEKLNFINNKAECSSTGEVYILDNDKVSVLK